MRSHSHAVIAVAIFAFNAWTLGPAVASTLLVQPPSAPRVVRPAGHHFSVRHPVSRLAWGAGFEAKLLLDEPFGTSSVDGFTSTGAACLTAGTSATPARSIPACGAAAPKDAAGAGALQLTASVADATGFVLANAALPTSAGLIITFTDYSFDGTFPGADGLSFFMTDASRTRPAASGPPGFALGYAAAGGVAGLLNGYLGVGLDEAGNFSNFNLGLTGGWGAVPNSVVVRGAESTKFAFLATTRNSAGYPAGLPFQLSFPTASSRPNIAPTVRITLSPTGTLSVAIDAHDGNGYLEDIATTMLVGARGVTVLNAQAQPRGPTSVYIGFAATTSPWGAERHQIGGLTVTTLGTSAPLDASSASSAGGDRTAHHVPELTGSLSAAAPR